MYLEDRLAICTVTAREGDALFARIDAFTRRLQYTCTGVTGRPEVRVNAPMSYRLGPVDTRRRRQPLER